MGSPATSALKQGAVLSLSPQQMTPQYRGLFGTIFGLIRNEGVKSLYGGIVPGLQRQCVFASIRIGLYDKVKDFYSNQLNLGIAQCPISFNYLCINRYHLSLKKP